MKYTNKFIDAILNDLKYKGERNSSLYDEIDTKVVDVSNEYPKEFTIYAMAVRGSTFVDIQGIFNKSIKNISNDIQFIKCTIAERVGDIIRVGNPNVPSVDSYLHIDKEFIDSLFKSNNKAIKSDTDYISIQIMLEHVKLNSPDHYIIARQSYVNCFSLQQIASNFGIDVMVVRVALNDVCQQLESFRNRFNDRLKVLPYTEVSDADIFNFCTKIGYPIIYTGNKYAMKPISDLKIDISTCMALNRCGIKYIYQLENQINNAKTKDWTFGLSGIGSKRKGDIENALSKFKESIS